MHTASAFTAGNYDCKPLMTDVIVKNENEINRKRWRFSQGLGAIKLMVKFGDISCPPAKRTT